jgi:hypothetical protein
VPAVADLLTPEPITQADLSLPVLRNHSTQSVTTIDGWGAALFGLPFLAAGFCTLLVAVNAIGAQKHAPDWLIGVIGSLFFLAGLFLFVHGFHGVIRKHSYFREAARNPNQPWLFDYHWDRTGIGFSAAMEVVRRLMMACAWTAFISIFVYIGFTARGAWPFAAFGSLFGLLGLVFWYRCGAMLLDFLRYGNSRLDFGSFPFFLGGRLHAELRAPRHLDSLDELTLIFRCVQERYVTTGMGNERTQQVVYYEVYKDSVTLDRTRLAGYSGAGIPVEFPIPPDKPQTFLARRPPLYWEIEAVGKAANGPAFAASFLVPVYKSS